MRGFFTFALFVRFMKEEVYHGGSGVLVEYSMQFSDCLINCELQTMVLTGAQAHLPME